MIFLAGAARAYPLRSSLKSALLAGALLASIRLAGGADVPWAVPDAPFRALLRAGRDAPSSPETGYAIELPEFGQTMPNLTDVLITDAKGQPVPQAKVWRGEGHTAILLAQMLASGQDYYAYFGGNRPRRQTQWTPKISLLLETRRLPAGTKLEDAQDLESAWKKADG